MDQIQKLQDRLDRIHFLALQIKDHHYHKCGVKCKNCGAECVAVDNLTRGWAKGITNIIEEGDSD